MRWPLMAEESGSEDRSGPGAPGGTSETGASPTPPESGLTSPTSLVDWRQDFPDDLKNSPTIQKYNTRLDAAKGLEELSHLVGRGVHLPDRRVHPKGSEGYQTSMEKVMAKLREFDPDYAPPAEADAYTLAVPEDREMFPEIAQQWKADFFDAGLTQQQVSKVMDAFWRQVANAENQQQAHAAQRHDEGQRVMQRRFGASVDRVKHDAEGLLTDFGRGAFGDDGVQALKAIQNARTEDGGYLMNNPYFVGALAYIKKGMSEGTMHDAGEYTGMPGQLEMKQAQWQELQNKRHSPQGLTEQEARQHRQLREELAIAQQRAQERRRVA